VLIKAAREKDTRRAFLLLGAILDTPDLADRLLEALRPSWSPVTETIAARRVRRGGESDDIDMVQLGRLLSDLFRHRLLLQFLVVGVGQRAPRTFFISHISTATPAEIFRPRTCQQHMGQQDMYRQARSSGTRSGVRWSDSPWAGCR